MIGQKHSPEYERWIHSAAWQKLRRAKLAQNPLCEDCLEHDKFVSATEVHHVYPVDDAMSRAEREKRMFDFHNLRALCHACHVKEHQMLGRSGSKKAAKKKNTARLTAFCNKFGINNNKDEQAEEVLAR